MTEAAVRMMIGNAAGPRLAGGKNKSLVSRPSRGGSPFKRAHGLGKRGLLPKDRQQPREPPVSQSAGRGKSESPFASRAQESS